MREPPPRTYYKYYDTPEGEDIMKKVITTTRYGIITGLIISTYDVLMYSHAISFGPMLKRYAYHTIPLGLMGATFALVSNGLTKYREKNDVLNYFAGGVACGPIAGAYLRSGHGLVLGGLALGVAAALKKDSVMNNFQFFPENKPIPHMQGIWSYKQDFTIVRDPRDEDRCGDEPNAGADEKFTCPVPRRT